MAIDLQQERQQVHSLVDQLPPAKLGAVRNLLEVMVQDNAEDETISQEEEAAVVRSKEWFQHNEGIPFEQVVADLGFTMDQIHANARKDPAA
jgi:hypothetical protein